MSNALYADEITNFLNKDKTAILGEITRNDFHDIIKNQKEAWLQQIELLQTQLKDFKDGYIIFEYTLPRVGGRIDTLILYKGIIFVLEFKVFAEFFASSAILQTRNYAFDLSNFHEESHNKKLVPILIATNAISRDISFEAINTNLYDVVFSNGSNLNQIISDIINIEGEQTKITAEAWLKSRYLPAPTIIEAAEQLYANHSVKEIAKHEAAENLDATFTAVNNIIKSSEKNSEKAICFITGVPGAGKTLAGLNIAIENQKSNEKDYACFLSGNFPLVKVLTEALAQNYSKENKVKISKARSSVSTFIQMIHHFRDQSLIDLENPPADHVVIFDEAQRAWHNKKLSSFMNDKKKHILSKLDEDTQSRFLKMSEPEILIDYVDRHKDWAVIVCLVGGGQDINGGEAGINEWFKSIKKNYQNWKIYISDQMFGPNYISLEDIKSLDYNCIPKLHLSVPIRSFRSEKVSEFAEALIDADFKKARKLYQKIYKVYPIALTRNLEKAKAWVLENVGNSSARFGIIATSKAKRLRTDGIWVEYKCKPEKWFLAEKGDIKSSFAMEEVATQFDIQGLEIDWGVIGWDADYRLENDKFRCYDSRGSGWIKTKDEYELRYTKNSYRVLLTRFRQGFIIFIPEGDENDPTRKPCFYDSLFYALKNVGLELVL